ncbi:MAG: hypothetical protein P8Y58_12655 [Novosphingobium sp.]
MGRCSISTLLHSNKVARRESARIMVETPGPFRAGLDFVREQGFLPLMRRPDRGRCQSRSRFAAV